LVPESAALNLQGEQRKATEALPSASGKKAVAKTGTLDPTSIRSAVRGDVSSQRDLITRAANQKWNRLDKNTKRALVSAMASLHTDESKGLLEKWLGQEKDEDIRSSIRRALTQAWAVHRRSGSSTGLDTRHSTAPDESRGEAGHPAERRESSSNGAGSSARDAGVSAEIARLKRLPLSEGGTLEELRHAAQGSSSAAVRATAIELLGRVSGGENRVRAVEALSELATFAWQRDENYLGALVLGSLSRLAALGDDEAKRHLAEIFARSRSDRQALIIEQLRRYGTLDTAPYLRELAQQEGLSDELVRRIERAINELRETGAEED
jgi:hypothetical protein